METEKKREKERGKDKERQGDTQRDPERWTHTQGQREMERE